MWSAPLNPSLLQLLDCMCMPTLLLCACLFTAWVCQVSTRPRLLCLLWSPIRCSCKQKAVWRRTVHKHWVCLYSLLICSSLQIARAILLSTKCLFFADYLSRMPSCHPTSTTRTQASAVALTKQLDIAWPQKCDEKCRKRTVRNAMLRPSTGPRERCSRLCVNWHCCSAMRQAPMSGMGTFMCILGILKVSLYLQRHAACTASHRLISLLLHNRVCMAWLEPGYPADQWWCLCCLLGMKLRFVRPSCTVLWIDVVLLCTAHILSKSPRFGLASPRYHCSATACRVLHNRRPRVHHSQWAIPAVWVWLKLHDRRPSEVAWAHVPWHASVSLRVRRLCV